MEPERAGQRARGSQSEPERARMSQREPDSEPERARVSQRELVIFFFTNVFSKK